MKSFKHYAGDVPSTKQLPIGCRWLRVLDFNPIGSIDLTPSNAMPVASAFASGKFFVPVERAAVKLDNRGFDPVRGYSIYRMFQNVGGSLEKFFGTVELLGDIEVQAGEAADADPGPLRFGQVGSNFGFATMSSLTAFFLMPKNAKSVQFHFIGVNAPITQIKIFAICPQLQGTPFVVDGGNYSSWEPGGVLDANIYPGIPPNLTTGPFQPVNFNSNGNNLIRPFNQHVAFNPVAIVAPNANIANIAIVDSGQAFDDVPNQSYIRVSPQAIGWAIFVSDGTVGGASNNIQVLGNVNCVF